ncbi:hypothetical protein [Dinghuibacter silviterrae]|uniref:Lipopolysaccharide biosynthesis glycosyltransferase n=1 Tax=Dinghuibacter silviterrae TaxID=1539049 RepID=A0A4R8DQK2_9BACT|nr:hypothetical protein [Dinghuibacter silviterrae]TDX00066.1 hypothetical protein EDB95_1082 [Dinghuibacter silviterrae]
MKQAAFTICAKNYIGLAQTLEQSIRKHSPETDFFIFVADEFGPGDATEELPGNVLVAKDVLDIAKDEWYRMCFKYEITEFCTAIKPWCFDYLFEKYPMDAIVYFDPDILVFATLNSIYLPLAEYPVLLTPHITTMEVDYAGTLPEQKLLFSGMYNLGFIGLGRSPISERFLRWWQVRLKDRCYQDKMESYFTDQKWIDFLPALLPGKVRISHDLGLNLAPWNFYEREIFAIDGCFFVRNRITRDDRVTYPLTFVHFSGFDYAALTRGEVSQKNISNFEVPRDMDPVFAAYWKAIEEGNFKRYSSFAYSYNFFSDGKYVSKTYRRLFRRLLEDGRVEGNPFEASGGFYHSLAQNGLLKGGMAVSDKTTISNVSNADKKARIINRFLYILCRCIGPSRFFILVRLMRLYSKMENHVYLIDKSYFKRFKLYS